MKILFIFLTLLNTHSFAAGTVTCSPAANCSLSSTSSAEGCRIKANQWCDITAVNRSTGDDDCRRVTNDSSGDIFVPAKTSTDDWMNFVTTDTTGKNVFKTSPSSCSTSSECSAGTLNWGSSCSGTSSLTSNGDSITISNTASGFAGSATYLCNNGTWTLQSGSTCSSSSGCNNASLYWFSGGTSSDGRGSSGYRCSAGTANLANGESRSVFGDSPHYGSSPCGCCTTYTCPGGINHNEGNATFTCNNGIITVTGKSCSKLAD